MENVKTQKSAYLLYVDFVYMEKKCFCLLSVG